MLNHPIFTNLSPEEKVVVLAPDYTPKEMERLKWLARKGYDCVADSRSEQRGDTDLVNR